MTNPNSREAFAKAENAWYEKNPPWERATFDAAGKICWAACEELDPLPEPRLHVERQYTPADNLEGWADDTGKVHWTPRVAPAPENPEPRRIKRLMQFFELPESLRTRLLQRAERHIPDWDMKASQEYAAYVLYTREYCHPFNKAEFRALKSEIGGKLRTRRSRLKG